MRFFTSDYGYEKQSYGGYKEKDYGYEQEEYGYDDQGKMISRFDVKIFT